MKPSFLTRRLITALGFAKQLRTLIKGECLQARWHMRAGRISDADICFGSARNYARLFASESNEVQACFDVISDKQLVLNLGGLA